MKSRLVVALAGNPNSGKTTLFNELTGAHQHVGNYPGVTVEMKQGSRHHGGVELMIADLPGIYSLTAHSAEELVARDFLLNQKPDVVVDVIDSSNLERNLYLGVQLVELGVPLVFVFNMSDMAKARGQVFDLERLSRVFEARIVCTVGHKGKGISELLDAIIKTARSNKSRTSFSRRDHSVATRGSRGRPHGAPVLHYGQEIETEIARVESLIDSSDYLEGKYDSRWLAVKLLENDRELRNGKLPEDIDAQVVTSSREIENRTGESPETALAGARYAFISEACHMAVRSTIEFSRTLSDRIDSIATNRVLGIPIFLGLMFLVFSLTFALGEPAMGWIENLFAWMGETVKASWAEGSGGVLRSLLADGIIGGVGGVLVFLPNIMLLFLAIAILEDSGYMTRVAFIMDRLMHKVGLQGKSFVPMLIGFGCSVPAIMATRTLESRRDRLTTMLVIPLISCGARLPIYALIIPAFFPQAWHAPMLWVIYLIGIVLAVLVAKTLRSTIFKGESVPFVMELPPYRMPTLKSVLIHMWERGWLYLKKAGTIILGLSILLWAMAVFPGLSEVESVRYQSQRDGIERWYNADLGEKAAALAEVNNAEALAALRSSASGRLGRFLEPALKPMGFDWRIGTALIGALAAKEVFIAQMGIVFSVGEVDEESSSLREKLQSGYSPLTGFCVMLFCLISAPCVATIAVTKRESGSWRWALLQLGGLTLIAYVITVIVFQAGTLLGIGT